ncbi:MAG: hypothetical protein CMO55_18710 [Verrucomicrobiales bacterium]|nr:hypothetical protein [Verrucomicrobiales bacterium]
MDAGSSDDLLKSVSRSFYLSMRFLPQPMREPISLGYLLARLTDTLADAPEIGKKKRMALLDEMRLVIQGKKDRLGDGVKKMAERIDRSGEKELLSRSDELIAWYRSVDQANRDHLSEVILTIIHGQVWDVRYFKGEGLTCCQSADDLLRYTYWVAGCVGEFWTKVGFTNLGERFAMPDNASDMLVSGRKLGQALQLINILRDLHEDIPNGRCYLPEDELRKAGWDVESELIPAEVEPVFANWLGVCRGFLDEADGYVRCVRSRRVRFCTKMPMILAEKTADRLEEAGVYEVMARKVKVPRSEVWKAMVKAGLF